MLKLSYFGMIAEAINKSTEGLMLVEDLTTLKVALELKYKKLAHLDYKFAVNQTLVTSNVVLKENDEIALLPPFAGG